MAEETLVKEVLTDAMISAGADLTRQLDRSHWPVVGALWLYEPEINEWRLLLASPVVGSEGPLAAYRRVNAALETLLGSRLSLEDISVVSPEDPRVRALASAYQTGSEIEGRRVFRSAVNGHYIDDAYVYRLLPIAPAA
jgi:hypothetical protein